jgi:hypothetical protein
LKDMFYDEEGNDEGGPPIVLNDFGFRVSSRIACSSWKLYHETTITNRLVIRSSRNNLGQQLSKDLDRQASWPPEPYQPQLNLQTAKKKAGLL